MNSAACAGTHGMDWDVTYLTSWTIFEEDNYEKMCIVLERIGVGMSQYGNSSNG